MKKLYHALNLILILFLTASFFSCSVQTDSAHFESLAVKETAYNPMLMIAAPDYKGNFLPGAVADYHNVPSRFAQSELGFQIERMIESEAGDYNYHEKVFKKITELSSKLKEDSSFLLHYSGHGTQKGKIVFHSKNPNSYIHVDDIINHIETQLKNPIARLILVLDACFSGKLAQEMVGTSNTIKSQDVFFSNLKQNSLSLNAYQNNSPQNNFNLVFNERKIKEVILVVSASYNETAGDVQNGGIFSVLLWQNLDRHIKERKNITLVDFFTNISKQVQQRNPTQTPQFAFFPAKIGSELLFFEKNQSSSSQRSSLSQRSSSSLQSSLFQSSSANTQESSQQNISSIENQSSSLSNHEETHQSSLSTQTEGPFLTVRKPTVLKKGSMAQSNILSSNLKCSISVGIPIYYETISSKINGHYMLKLKKSPEKCEHLGITNIYVYADHVENNSYNNQPIDDAGL